MEAAELSDLLQRVAEKDRSAFKLLFEHFAPRLKAYMYRLSNNETVAEELAQKTMVKIWNKAHLYDPAKATASTWIFRVARNLRIDEIRKEHRYQYDEYNFDHMADTSDSAEEVINREQHADIVRSALSKLSEDQKTVLELSFYEGMSHSMISEKLDIPLGTVKSRMRLAFSKLRIAIGDIR
ncbi:MAG: sigma-70 family RNA polymerase sigma factor [Alphaproteobacteria bacterium]|nr:sigma-70 family RNA polymerase sigma factor [Alphaproteobacteria bacterium]